EPFRVVEPARHIVRVEDDRCSNARPGERPTARLVAAGDRPNAALERRTLAAEGRPKNFLLQRQAGGLCGATHAAMLTTTRRPPQRASGAVRELRGLAEKAQLLGPRKRRPEMP